MSSKNITYFYKQNNSQIRLNYCLPFQSLSDSYEESASEAIQNWKWYIYSSHRRVTLGWRGRWERNSHRYRDTVRCLLQQNHSHKIRPWIGLYSVSESFWASLIQQKRQSSSKPWHGLTAGCDPCGVGCDPASEKLSLGHLTSWLGVFWVYKTVSRL